MDQELGENEDIFEGIVSSKELRMDCTKQDFEAYAQQEDLGLHQILQYRYVGDKGYE